MSVCNERLNSDCRQRPRQSDVVASAGAGTGMRLGVPPITYFYMTSTFVVLLDTVYRAQEACNCTPAPHPCEAFELLVSGSQGLPLAGFLRQMETYSVPRSFYSTELPAMRASLTELFASSNPYPKQ